MSSRKDDGSDYRHSDKQRTHDRVNDRERNRDRHHPYEGRYRDRDRSRDYDRDERRHRSHRDRSRSRERDRAPYDRQRRYSPTRSRSHHYRERISDERIEALADEIFASYTKPSVTDDTTASVQINAQENTTSTNTVPDATEATSSRHNGQEVTKRQISIPRSVVEDYLSQYGHHALQQALSRVIVKHSLEFPFKRYFIKEVDSKFQNLCAYRCKLLYDQQYTIPTLVLKTSRLNPPQFRGRYLLLPSEKNEYDDMNLLSDYFQEEARVRSLAGFHSPSVMQHWTDAALHPKWIRSVFRNTSSGIGTYELREALYGAVKTEPTTFKATVAATTIRELEGTRVLDFCAGWGDRLLGALSCQDSLQYYVGVDPNSMLFTGYQQMIQRFAPTCTERFCMLNEPFETCDLPTDKRRFDLVFTGPPYFDYEKYGTTGANQSITTFPDAADWTVKFLFTCIEKAWQLLDAGGHMALNVNDVMSLVQRNIVYTEAMNLFIQYRFSDADYSGVFCFTGANYQAARPIWVYKKNPPPEASTDADRRITRADEARELLRVHYTEIFDKLKETDMLRTLS